MEMSEATGWSGARAARGFSVDAASLPLEGGVDPDFGTVRWRTLVSSDRTPSEALTLGLAEFAPRGTLLPHRHGPAEFYLGLDGAGIVTIDGVPHPIGPGIAVFIPSEAEHGVVAGAEGLRFAYGFPTARFAEVDYRFSQAG
ncbi:dimethylsulfoniopropionate lyase [Limimaricola cinnabarinus]|jgi:quercetin dioxygenase-like cupin family protein|uniref:Dimethylsulfoniopropionate lyase n=2 Tax=Limimaricola cinnabarinus TaxID=1125964 RepID=A0A2G1MFP7_9RHOB|nr:dimethylsulfoniopropionate lyase [Limimaricola cinnabarinus]